MLQNLKCFGKSTVVHALVSSSRLRLGRGRFLRVRNLSFAVCSLAVAGDLAVWDPGGRPAPGLRAAVF